jgi:hypothetical protein
MDQLEPQPKVASPPRFAAAFGLTSVTLCALPAAS